MNTAPSLIRDRLKPLEIIQRAEDYENAWSAWAVFWMAIGALLGAAATLTLVLIKMAG